MILPTTLEFSVKTQVLEDLMTEKIELFKIALFDEIF